MYSNVKFILFQTSRAYWTWTRMDTINKHSFVLRRASNLTCFKILASRIYFFLLWIKTRIRHAWRRCSSCCNDWHINSHARWEVSVPAHGTYFFHRFPPFPSVMLKYVIVCTRPARVAWSYCVKPGHIAWSCQCEQAGRTQSCWGCVPREIRTQFDQVNSGWGCCVVFHSTL